MEKMVNKMVEKSKSRFGAHNMSGVDRIVRVVVGIVLIASAFVYAGLPFVILAVLGVVLLFTSAVNSCPIYSTLKISTNK